ncbi:MAG: hypothetical protein GX802_07875 [Clostridiales bacterium]|nr:hypothetical protein [Clostridiales bacterium]
MELPDICEHEFYRCSRCLRVTAVSLDDGARLFVYALERRLRATDL